MIDPHLKWQLRRKLKQIHHELKLTLIYVTHDQVEALTFADEVLVMTRGKAVQLGSADALFERPEHTFVGHFIGSPGMNFLPAHHAAGVLTVLSQPVTLAPPLRLPTGSLQLGIRPEYLSVSNTESAGCLLAQVRQVQDIGTYQLLTCEVGEHLVKARLSPETMAPAIGSSVHLRVLDKHTCFYQNEELVA